MNSARLFLRHDVSIEHVCCCITKKVHYYNVLNAQGRLLYRVFRRHKQTPDRPRPYELIVKDPDGITVCSFTQMKDRRYRRKLSIQYPPKNTIGYVEQTWSFCHKPYIHIKNKDQERTIQIVCTKRPLLSHCRYHSQFNFDLISSGAHNVIGKISSEWIDTPPGAFESERVYGVSFPKDLTAEVKISILAAWLLLYINYYKGKLDTCVHYTLTEEELALIRLVEDSEEDKHKVISREPSSDSDEVKDQAILQHYRKSFEVAAITAKKKIGVGNRIDFNQNN